MEQVSVNMATKSEHSAPNKEMISSLVENIQAPAEKDSTPDSDGSMQGSSGSEALEEALKDAGIVNGEKHEEKGSDKPEKGEKKDEKTGKSKKKEDKTIGWYLFIKFIKIVTKWRDREMEICSDCYIVWLIEVNSMSVLVLIIACKGSKYQSIFHVKIA